jgi:hypothetical protein
VTRRQPKGKRRNTRIAEQEMRREYDFSGGVRGRYLRRYRQGTNLVLLEPDVSAAFPTSEAVNQALRSLVAKRRTRRGTVGHGGGKEARRRPSS